MQTVPLGVDLAKNVFQLHGAAADGSIVFTRSCHGRSSSVSLPVASEPNGGPNRQPDQL